MSRPAPLRQTGGRGSRSLRQPALGAGPYSFKTEDSARRFVLASVPVQVRSTDHMITLQIGKLVPVRLCAEYADMRHEHAC